VVQLHRILHNALGQAARWDLVGRNVADLVKPPRVPRYELALPAAYLTNDADELVTELQVPVTT